MIYAAQFHDSTQGPVVGHLTNHHLDAGLLGDDLPGEDLISALKSIAKTRHFKGKVVNVHLPEKHLNCFMIDFDLGADETLETAIARECRRSLSLPLEEAVVDYASLVESKTRKRRYKAAIVAARKEIIDAYLSMTRRAGLSVADHRPAPGFPACDCTVICSFWRIHPSYCAMWMTIIACSAW